MKDLNHVTVIGRLTRDAEFKDGKCNFSVAFNTTKKDGDKWVDEVNYLNLMLFDNFATALQPRLTKGTQVAITGHLKQSRWEKDGQKMSALNVVVDKIQMVGGKKSESTESVPFPSSNNNASDVGTPFDDFGF